MALRVRESCIGCGACESACHARAISQSESFAVAYVVDPLLCNDCLDCVVVCPVFALVDDPEWAVCLGRGCPLSSDRYAGWECSQAEQRCDRCGSVLWRAQAGDWTCRSCTMTDTPRQARCPKVDKARRPSTRTP